MPLNPEAVGENICNSVFEKLRLTYPVLNGNYIKSFRMIPRKEFLWKESSVLLSIFPPLGKDNHLISMRAKTFLSKDEKKAGIYSNQNLLHCTMTFKLKQH